MTMNDGELTAIRMTSGAYRWDWTSVKGTTHVSGKTYRRKADALKAGRLWLKEREKRSPRALALESHIRAQKQMPG